MQKYQVHFQYFDRRIGCVIEANVNAPQQLSANGFWINNNLEMTTTSKGDQVYFIPPSRIIAIEKLR